MGYYIGIIIGFLLWCMIYVHNELKDKWYHMEVFPEATTNYLVIRNLKTEQEFYASYDSEFNRYFLRSGQLVDFDFIWRYNY